jgi:hypothetical protein
MKRLSVLAMMAMALAFFCTPAHAVLEMKVTDGTTSVDILDGGVGDLCGVVNCVTFIGPIGGWAINVHTGKSKTAAGLDLIDLNFDATKISGSAKLTISLSDDGFSPASPGFLMQIGGTQNAGGSIAASLFGGNSNLKFDMSQQDGVTLTSSISPFALTQTTGNVGKTSPYSLTQVVVLDYGSGTGETTGDYSVVGVPEPASVAMFGGMLLATFGAIRRRMRRS